MVKAMQSNSGSGYLESACKKTGLKKKALLYCLYPKWPLELKNTQCTAEPGFLEGHLM